MMMMMMTREGLTIPGNERPRGLNKKDLATEAEKAVSGTRWLPELLGQ